MILLRFIRFGVGDLPGCGSHPGTIWVVAMIVMAFVAGITRPDNSIVRALVGAALMAAIIGPIYLVGAYHRGKDYCLRRAAECDEAGFIAEKHHWLNGEAR